VTRADRIAAVLEVQPLPVCVLATEARMRKTDVITELNGNLDRFAHNGRKARASRWYVRRGGDDDVSSVGPAALTWPADYDAGEDALCELVRQGRRSPEDALVLAICVVNGAPA
jgi:hypothetical protein